MSLIVKKDFGVIDSGSCIVGFTLGFAVCLGTFVDNFTPNVPESKVHLQNLRIQQKKAKILQVRRQGGARIRPGLGCSSPPVKGDS